MTLDSNFSAVSNIKTITNSIKHDRQVYRWFLLFLSTPKIHQELSKKPQLRQIFNQLNKAHTAQLFSLCALIFTALISCISRHFWTLVLEIPVLGLLVHLSQKKQIYVAAISEAFLLSHIPAITLNSQTLYQTCEKISQEYHLPSLVDLITFQDTIARRVLLSSLLILPFIYSFKNWQLWSLTIAIYLTTLFIINTTIVLKNLK